MYIIFLVAKEVDEDTLESKIYVDSLYPLETYKIVDFDPTVNPVERLKQRTTLTGKSNERLEQAIDNDVHVFKAMEMRKMVNHRMTMHGIYYDGNYALSIAELDILLKTKKDDGTLKEFLESSKL